MLEPEWELSSVMVIALLGQLSPSRAQLPERENGGQQSSELPLCLHKWMMDESALCEMVKLMGLFYNLTLLRIPPLLYHRLKLLGSLVLMMPFIHSLNL